MNFTSPFKNTYISFRSTLGDYTDLPFSLYQFQPCSINKPFFSFIISRSRSLCVNNSSTLPPRDHTRISSCSDMNGKAQESQPQIKYPAVDHETLYPCRDKQSGNSGLNGDHQPVFDEKWGTHVMGTPAVPTCHPNNQKAALWGAADQKQIQYNHYPYLHYSPVQRTTAMDSVLHKFNSWSRKAETTANNIWHNLKTGPSVHGAAWAKVNLTAKAITGGGFESLYKQTFPTFPNENLKKTFASYLSTSTGPVAGTLYLSNFHVAFCSDRPLSFTAPSGQQTWSYYKILIPLGSIGAINPVIMKENSSERYIQILTVDGQDFWFMGFVNYEKACQNLTQTISTTIAVSGLPQKPAVA